MLASVIGGRRNFQLLRVQHLKKVFVSFVIALFSYIWADRFFSLLGPQAMDELVSFWPVFKANLD